MGSRQCQVVNAGVTVGSRRPWAKAMQVDTKYYTNITHGGGIQRFGTTVQQNYRCCSVILDCLSIVLPRHSQPYGDMLLTVIRYLSTASIILAFHPDRSAFSGCENAHQALIICTARFMALPLNINPLKEVFLLATDRTHGRN